MKFPVAQNGPLIFCVVAAIEDQMHRVTGARKSTWAQISGRFKLHR
ncbi:MAG TPA: hypothetical protein VFP37_15225 [Steroidobacteraceae bacterium]|nr:hypothetical protein [Steroidobacteraceae bacterium]